MSIAQVPQTAKRPDPMSGGMYPGGTFTEPRGSLAMSAAGAKRLFLLIQALTNQLMRFVQQTLFFSHLHNFRFPSICVSAFQASSPKTFKPGWSFLGIPAGFFLARRRFVFGPLAAFAHCKFVSCAHFWHDEFELMQGRVPAWPMPMQRLQWMRRR